MGARRSLTLSVEEAGGGGERTRVPPTSIVVHISITYTPPVGSVIRLCQLCRLPCLLALSVPLRVFCGVGPSLCSAPQFRDSLILEDCAIDTTKVQLLG